ncbi:protein tramtrack, alpha isoform-like [Teleopsis dalmanni]|uniref:protein tramtrack, alpha isoform-like n=1 Tax=Teleopsis dalmanni TaxID=139649 RepID=UPI0018CFB839|nr:protein tramtrack, alpha isoform-like [Teleopsis dalmanni]
MTPVTTQHNQSQQQNPIIDITDTAPQLPTALGLRIRNTHKQSSQITINTNSLLKQQLRAGPKDVDTTTMGNNNKLGGNGLENMSNNDACSALQSLASVAERQAPNTIQPPTANNLHQQFLLHLATNPMMKSSNDFFQQQQQLTQQQQLEDELVVNNLDLTLESNDKSEPELILADENAGLDYKLHENGANDSNLLSINESTLEKQTTNTPTRPIQRRRIRRKAQSSLDDQAEHLTEMSVRGLDLFRYASISEGVYQCTECAKENVQKTFKNKYSFQRHAFLYHEGKHRKVFPCPLCGKEFSRPDKMKNHMKMTHESYTTKDNSNFNPLNYLITAAANETHPTVYPPQTVGQQQQAHILNEATTDEYMGINLTQQNSPLSPKPGVALLKLQNDIIIKNEIVISPSPSPPPKAEMETTQRLEEVK